MGTFVESSFETSDRTSLWVRQWMPEGEPCSVIFVAHGGADHGGRFTHLAKRWSSQGALVVAHDHRGQGRSGGPPGHVDSFAQYWNDLNELQAKIRQEAKVEHLPWFLFGHSMGGLVTLGYLCEFQSSASSLPRGAIVSAPLLGLAMKVNPFKELLGRIMLRIAPTFAVDPKLPAEYLCRDAAVVEDYRSDPKRTRVVSAGWARGHGFSDGPCTRAGELSDYAFSGTPATRTGFVISNKAAARSLPSRHQRVMIKPSKVSPVTSTSFTTSHTIYANRCS